MERFETVEDVYRLFCKVGCCSFATLDGGGGVESRIAHFFAGDEDGLYLRTMRVKPFYRQLVEGGRLSVSGEFTEQRIQHDENNLPVFQPGFAVRVSGEVRELSMEEVQRKASGNRDFNVAVHDIRKYPETRVFVLFKGHAECFDYDFGMVRRNHKLLRKRVVFGGDAVAAPGLRIGDECIGCGSCFDICSYKAIVPGEPYAILGERCDECGNCYLACPVGAVKGKAADGSYLEDAVRW